MELLNKWWVKAREATGRKLRTRSVYLRRTEQLKRNGERLVRMATSPPAQTDKAKPKGDANSNLNGLHRRMCRCSARSGPTGEPLCS